MTKLFVTFVMAAALAACGSKPKKSTTPENKGATSTQTEMNGSGSTGGATYGGAAMPAGSGSGSAGGDPCGM